MRKGMQPTAKWQPTFYTPRLHTATDGDEIIDLPQLTVPHPRMHERAFVLAPLVELAPDIVIPRHGHAVDALKTVGGQRFSKISA